MAARRKKKTKKKTARRGSSKKKSRGGFKYRGRTQEQHNRRVNQRSGQFDSFLLDKFQTFKPQDGQNRIRILPPTFEDADHYGIDIFVHYGVGPDNQAYLDLQKHKGKADPVSEEYERAKRSGDDEYARKLSSKKRCLVWVIDRDKEDEGPKLWAMPWTVDRDISEASLDPDTREALPLDHHEEGYDVIFRKEGSKLTTKYIGVQLSRHATPILDDEDAQNELLEFLTDNPLPSCLRFYDYDHIAKQFNAAVPDEDEDEDEKDDEPKPRNSRRSKARDEEDDDEDEEDDDLDGDDEIDDEDDELDEDEDDDEEFDDDEDDDSDEDDEYDEDDDEEFDDDESEDEDDDEEEEDGEDDDSDDEPLSLADDEDWDKGTRVYCAEHGPDFPGKIVGYDGDDETATIKFDDGAKETYPWSEIYPESDEF